MSKGTAYTQLEIESEDTTRTKESPIKAFLHGWRVTVSISALVTFLVLWVNVALLVWAQKKGVYTIDDDGLLRTGTTDVITLYAGSCKHRDSLIR